MGEDNIWVSSIYDDEQWFDFNNLDVSSFSGSGMTQTNWEKVSNIANSPQVGTYASMGASVLGGLQSYRANAKQAESQLTSAYVQAELTRLRGKQIEESAQKRAALQMSRGIEVNGSQEAIQASSGIVTTSGSALNARLQTQNRIIADAITMIQEGSNNRITANTNARFQEMSGKSSAKSLLAQGSSSFNKGVAQAGAIYSDYQLLQKKEQSTKKGSLNG